MAIKSATRSTLENNIFYRSMLAGNESIILEDEYLLEEQVLSSSAASVTFSGLSQYAGVYQHLQIRAVGKMTNTNQYGDDIILRFNGDSGNNYAAHQLWGETGDSTPNSNKASIISGITLQRFTQQQVTGSFGAFVMDILDPFETTKNTTIRSLGGMSENFSYIMFNSGAWFNTNALTSMTFTPNFGGNFTIGSRFSLYGVK